MRRTITLLSSLAILSGCASLPKYEEPTSAASAKLRIKMAEPIAYSLIVSTLDTEACKLASYVGNVVGGSNPDSRRIGMLESTGPQEGILERVIPVNQEFAVVPFMINPKYNAAELLAASLTPLAQGHLLSMMTAPCSVPMFTPREGKQYELAFRPSPEKCEVRLFTLEAAADGTTLRKDITAEQTRTATYYKLGQDLTCTK